MINTRSYEMNIPNWNNNIDQVLVACLRMHCHRYKAHFNPDRVKEWPALIAKNHKRDTGAFCRLCLSSLLGGFPFNGPLSGTKYPTRAASPIQNASTPKSSLPFSKHRSSALLCAVVRRFY